MYSKDVIEKFRKFATASISDACDQAVKGRRCHMDYRMKPRIAGKKIVGPAITVLEGKNDDAGAPSHAIDAIEEAEGGEVMVIVLKEEDMNVALWGGLMTAGAVAKKLEGTVLNCGVRDVTEIKRDFGYEVYSCSVSPVTTVSRYVTLDKNVPVTCAGAYVEPGDLIVGDEDGVICIPKESVEEVMRIAEDIEKKEAQQTICIRETGSLKEGLAKFNRI